MALTLRGEKISPQKQRKQNAYHYLSQSWQNVENLLTTADTIIGKI